MIVAHKFKDGWRVYVYDGNRFRVFEASMADSKQEALEQANLAFSRETQYNADANSHNSYIAIMDLFLLVEEHLAKSEEKLQSVPPSSPSPVSPPKKK